MSTQGRDAKVQAVFDEADDHVRTITKALDELDTAVTERDYKTADRVIGEAFRAADSLLHKSLDEDIARLVDAITPKSSDTGDAEEDVLKAYSLLWTVHNSLTYRDQVEGKGRDPSLGEFIKGLIYECSDIADMIRRGQETRKMLPSVQLRLRVLRLAIDDEDRTDEQHVVEIAQWYIERAEHTLSEVQS